MDDLILVTTLLQRSFLVPTCISPIFFSKSDHSNHILDQTTNYKRFHSIINPISGSNRWFFSGRDSLGATWEEPKQIIIQFYNNITGGVYFKKKITYQWKIESEVIDMIVNWGLAVSTYLGICYLLEKSLKYVSIWVFSHRTLDFFQESTYLGTASPQLTSSQ